MTSTTARPAELTGRIVRPGDADYPVASAGYNLLFTHDPAAIVFAREKQDVVNALAWARQNNVTVRVRSGRHSLEGWSNVDHGIVIDISEMKSATIDKASSTATVGAGLNQLEAVTALGKAGVSSVPRLAAVSGSLPAASAWPRTTCWRPRLLSRRAPTGPRRSSSPSRTTLICCGRCAV